MTTSGQSVPFLPQFLFSSPRFFPGNVSSVLLFLSLSSFTTYIAHERKRDSNNERGGWDLYLASLRARHVPTNTIKAYTHDLRHFVSAVPADLAWVIAPLIQRFLEGDGHHSEATQGRRYSTLCSFYHWAMRQELVTDNPMERLDPITQPKREPRPLAHTDVMKIFKAIPTSNVRDRTLFMLLYETGVQVGEVLVLQVSDVSLTQDDEKLRIFAKGQRERTVMLTAAPESIRLLRRHFKQSHITSGSVFRGDPP